MCIYFYYSYVSFKNLCTTPCLLVLQILLFIATKKRIARDKILLFQHEGEHNFFGRFWTTVFSFFCHRGFLCTRIGETNESIFFPSQTTHPAYRHFSHRDTLLCSTIRTYTRTQHNTYKMFSMTQSASFCATKVNVAAQKKQQSKIKRSSIQAKAIISSESLSKRDFLSAAVLSFGFLSVGDANAATKRVRKTSSSAAPVKKSPAATKKSAAKPAYKPKGKTVVPAPSVATSPASRRGRRGVPIAGKSSSVSGGKRKNRSPAQARKGKY